MSSNRKPELDTAYALQTPEESVELYRDWAKTYDDDFAEARGYVYPELVAKKLEDLITPRDLPILDVGCGTGLVAEALGSNLAGQTDGLDISPEMLEVAGAKGLYRNRIEGNLLDRLPMEDGIYGAIISAGTFTHGHVGPNGLDECLRVARAGALFVIGINRAHFDAAGFADYLARQSKAVLISAPQRDEVAIYAKSNDAHAKDTAFLVHFRKK